MTVKEIRVRAADGVEGNVELPHTRAANTSVGMAAPTGEEPLFAPGDAPSLPDLDAGSDTGASDSDNLTNDTTPTLTGTGPADTTIRIYEGGVLVAEGTSDSAGNWSITLPAQTEGTHAYEARSVDGLGDETPTARDMIATGGEVQVNIFTTSFQGEPQLTGLEGGGYVITWMSHGEDGDTAYDIRAQVYDASGALVGGELLVNTFTTGHQQTQRVTALEGGGFVVVWQSADQDGSGYGVYAQRYDASGAPAGGEFRVNAYTNVDQVGARVEALAGGGFVVTWHSALQDGDGNGVFARVYDASGVATTGDVQVNTFTTGPQEVSEVTVLEGGGFVVVWRSGSQDGSNYGVYGQVFDADGTPSGSEFRLNTYTTSQQLAPQVTALEGGGFLATWQSLNQDGSGYGVYGQVYDAAGAASGGEFRVNSFTTDAQQEPRPTALEGGGFVVVWTSLGQDGSVNGVYGQVYDASGAASGGEFRVNTHTTSDQLRPQITALNGGGFVVVWHSSGQDGSAYGVYAQVYDASGAPSGGELAVNTYTDGDQALPQVTALEDGGFVVAWRSFGQDGSSFSVYSQRYTPESGLLEVTIDTTAPSDSGSTTPSANEGGSVNLDGSLLQADDVGGEVTFELAGLDNGALFLDGVALEAGDVFTQADVDAGRITFTHDGSETLTGGFSFTTRDQHGNESSVQTFDIAVTPVNEAPEVDGVADVGPFLENAVNAAPQLMGLTVTLTDPEGNFDGGTLTLSGLLAEDRVSVRDEGTGAGQVGLSGADVTYGGVVIGTLVGGVGNALTITFNAAADTAALNAVIQNLTYANASDTPTASRNLTLNVTDDDGEDLDAPAVITLTVASENDAPTLTGLTASIAFDETDVNAGPQLLDADVTFADPEGDFEGGSLTLSGVRNEDRISVRDEGSAAGEIGFDADTGEVSYGGVVIGTLAGGAGSTLTVTFNAAATSAAVDALIENLTYANVSNTPTPSRDLFLNVTDADGADLIGARTFELADSGTNPLDPYDLGERVTPALVDLDGDGDLDLVTGDASGRLRTFENDRGVFIAPSADPFAGIDVGDDSTPAFADLDDDGDLDLVVGDLFGGLRTFENDGGVFAELAGAANPFAGIAPRFEAKPSFADLDGDGDLDLVVGEASGALRAFRNDSGVFTQLVGAADPFDGLDMGSGSTAAFLDLDGDGDLDLVGGQFSGSLLVFENVGGTFGEWSAASPFEGIDMAGARRPTLGDIDGDGDLDLLVGRNDGGFDLILNTTERGHRITLEVTPDADEPILSGLTASVPLNENDVNAAPVLLDADVTFDDLEQNFDGGVLSLSGLLAEDRASVRNEGTAGGQIGLSGSDVTFGGVVIGTLAGGAGATLTITFNAAATAAAIDALIQNLTYANTSDAPTASRDLLLNVTDASGADLGPAPVPAGFVEADAAANPFDGFDVGEHSKPTFVDLDGDGDLDPVVGSGNGPGTGALRAFDNDGGVFSELIGAASPFNGLMLGDAYAPAFADLDADGDLDLVIGTMDATLRAFDDDGGAFTELAGAANPFDGVSLGGINATPAFVDLDGDSDLDLVVGGNEGTLRAFANDGGAFTELAGAANPFDGLDVGFSSAPTFTDLDGDGDLDLVAAEAEGALLAFENDGGVFTQLSGAANPFDGIDVGSFGAPSFFDVDGDGDLDAVVGEDGGTLRTFLNTTAHGRVVTVTVNAETDTYAGDSGDNVVSGSAGDDAIDGLDGDDVLAGGGGDDVLDGGDGVDTADYTDAASGVLVRLFGGVTPGDGDSGSDTLVSIENVTGSGLNDTLLGSAGANVLRGGAGQDYLMGLAGNDVLFGGSGASNQLQGGAGDDDYHVDANDTLLESAGQGHDRVFTSQGRLVLAANLEDLAYVGGGAFTGVGNAGNNRLTGGAGDDTLSGRGGDDVLIGGSGSDTADYSLASGGVFVMLDIGFADDGGGGTDTLIGIENLQGSASHDLLFGSAGNNVIDGGAGDDLLVGRGGDDTLRGGAGLDLVDYSEASSGVVVKLNTGRASDGDGGTDTLIAIEDAGGSRHDDVLIGGAGANALYGLEGGDYLIGLGGNDVLSGGAGAPNQLQGGLGDDRYLVEGNDTLIEYANEGFDTVATTLNSYTLLANFEALAFDGVGDFAGVGNELDNVIDGGAGDDTLTGGGGDDTLRGGAGLDLADYSGAAAGVTVKLNNGRASDGGGGTDTLISIEDASGGAHNDVLIGNAGDNALYGLDGSDYLAGLGGNDVLSGGAGAPNQLQGGLGDDRYHVEANDTLIEFAGEGFDTVATTLNSYTLRDHFEALAFGGVGDFAGTGNGLDNVIHGGSGDDILTGGGGDDVLTGSSICGCGEAGEDTVVLAGVLADYVIEDLGGGSWRVTDTVADRDGIDLLADIALLRFSDGSTFQLVAAGPAPLEAKEADMAQVLPGLTADGLLLPKDADLTLVLPGVEPDLTLEPVADEAGLFGLTNPQPALDPAGGYEHPSDGAGLLHNHDGWLF